MANVTYLLGAGASAGKRGKDLPGGNPNNNRIVEGLPCVKDIPNRLKNLELLIRSARIPQDPLHVDVDGSLLYSYEDWDGARKQLLKDVHELQTKCAEHSTIDTYAKKLYLTCDSDAFSHLERMLAFYFIVEQILTKPDSRYDTFFANVLQRGRVLPKNIKIISWNYDSQLEIAYNEYSNELDKLKVGTKKYSDYQEYSIMKINGTATFENMKQEIPVFRKTVLQHLKDPERNLQILYDIIPIYLQYVVNNNKASRHSTDLSYAFDEQNYPSEAIFRWADEQIEKTDALVVIGYTFPFFNREIDRRLLSRLRPSAKIYIQDLNTEYVKQSLQAVLTDAQRDIPIFEMKRTDQFYLPPEL